MRLWLSLCVCLWLLVGAAWAGAAPAAGTAPGPAPSEASTELLRQVLATRDHGHRPFAIVDKRAALLLVYRGDGSLAGSTGVLLGRVPGDHSEPGVGERTQAGRLRPEDATTPAGRFISSPGRNRSGEAVIWVDPDTAFAIHRLRGDGSAPSRIRRLASHRLQDRRASAGCVVVPVAFYEDVVQTVLGARRGVVYVMPEFGPWQSLWADRAAAAL